MSSGGLNASQALVLISTLVLERLSDGRATLWALDEDAADHAHRLLRRLFTFAMALHRSHGRRDHAARLLYVVD